MIGIGTDIVDVNRIRRILARFGDRFADRILTDAERRDLSDMEASAAYLARQFAAKEAVSKALGSGMRRGVHFRCIEVTRLASGAPTVQLLGTAGDYASSLGIDEVRVSISDEKDYAVAFAIALTGSGPV